MLGSQERVIIPGIQHCKGFEVTIQMESFPNKGSSNKEQREITNPGV